MFLNVFKCINCIVFYCSNFHFIKTDIFIYIFFRYYVQVRTCVKIMFYNYVTT